MNDRNQSIVCQLYDDTVFYPKLTLYGVRLEQREVGRLSLTVNPDFEDRSKDPLKGNQLTYLGA